MPAPIYMLAPIVLFAYKRANELQRTLTALQANYLADQSELFVFVDGPRPGRADEVTKVNAVREVLGKLTGFRRIHRIYRDQNMGCANSIIAGVTTVLQTHRSVIVLEDDILTSRNFLDYMNQCLEQYAGTPKVFSIGGYTFPFPRPEGYESDVYFFGRTCAWGWGIWADRWEQVDWALTDYDSFRANEAACRAFNADGQDRVRMLKRAYTKEIDAWDIRLCYSEFKLGGVTAYPTSSKTINIGIDSVDSTTEVVYNRYKTVLDSSQQRRFLLPVDVSVNPAYARRFRRKFSVPVRAWNKLKTFLLAGRLAVGKRSGVGKPVEQ